MKRLEQLPVEPLGQTGGETAIDTQIEVDLICGGVGFDDGPACSMPSIILPRGRN